MVALVGMINIYIPTVHGQVVEWSPEVKKITLGKGLEYFEDTNNDLRYEKIVALPQHSWMESEQTSLNFGFSSSAYWIRFQLNNVVSDEQTLWLQSSYPLIELIEVYQLDQGLEMISVHKGGTFYPFASRPISHRTFLFPITLAPQEVNHIYIKVSGDVSLQLPLTLWSLEAFHSQDFQEMFILGMYIGVILVTSCYSLFMSVTTKYKSYILYIPHVFFLSIFLIDQLGIFYQYLWPDSPFWEKWSRSLFASLALSFGIFFVQSYFYVQNETSPLNKTSYAVMIQPFSIVIFMMLDQYQLSIWMLVLFGFSLLPFSFWKCYRNWQQYQLETKLFLCALLSLLIGVIFYVLNIFGVFTSSLMRNHEIYIGLLLEVILISLSLAYRIQFLDRSLQKQNKNLIEISKQHQLVATALDHINDIVEITDSHATILYVNPAVHRVMGYTPAEVRGNFASMFRPSHLSTENYQEVHRELGKKQMWKGEFLAQRKDGSICSQEVIITPIVNNENQIVNHVAVKRDITERKRAEKELLELNQELERRIDERTQELQKERDKALIASKEKSKFLANMSHEIRTPMNSILGLSELLYSAPLPNETKEYAKLIYVSAENLLAILNNILDFSKIEAGKLELDNQTFSLYQVLEDIILIFQMQFKEKGITLDYDLEPQVPNYIKSDITRIRQILTNLLGNALKFTPKGHVKVYVKNRSLSPQKEGSILMLEFMIEDTGVGIPQEKQTAIFESFSQADPSTTREYGGTGLGLTISSEFVRLMKGNIWLESVVGKGTQFYFTIQVSIPSTQEVEKLQKQLYSIRFSKKSVNAEATTATYNILLAEDNLVNQKLATKIFKGLGYEITIVETGQQVLDQLEKKSFDIIFMDIQMPQMDGITATQLIRQKYGNETLIIAMTANALEEDRKKCLNAGMNDYLSKPVKIKDISEMLRKWLI